MRTARYVGGPLDGQTVTKEAGPFHDYHDDDGRPVNVHVGSGEHRAGRFYRFERWRGQDLFVHGSCWDPVTGAPKGWGWGNHVR